MKIASRILLTLALLTIISCPLWAANNDNHDVTVTIAAINELNVSGNITITVDTATPGQQPDTETDSTSTLDYTTNSASNKKITGQYSVVGGDTGITLSATASSASGTSLGKKALASGSAADLVNTITQCADAGQQLEYEVVALVTATVGDHVFTVTYTLTDE